MKQCKENFAFLMRKKNYNEVDKFIRIVIGITLNVSVNSVCSYVSLLVDVSCRSN